MNKKKVTFRNVQGYVENLQKKGIDIDALREGEPIGITLFGSYPSYHSYYIGLTPAQAMLYLDALDEGFTKGLEIGVRQGKQIAQEHLNAESSAIAIREYTKGYDAGKLYTTQQQQCNGYANYETFLLSMHLSNEEQVVSKWKATALDIRAHTKATQDETHWQIVNRLLAERLESVFTAKCDSNHIVARLALAATYRICWRELSTEILTTWLEWQEEKQHD